MNKLKILAILMIGISCNKNAEEPSEHPDSMTYRVEINCIWNDQSNVHNTLPFDYIPQIGYEWRHRILAQRLGYPTFSI